MYVRRRAESILGKLLNSGKVVMVLGARQVGKTTLVKRILAEQDSVFLNLDLEIDQQRFLTASALPPNEALKTLGVREFLVIDEAQRVPDTGRIVKGWYDADVHAKIILLGSSSLNLLDKAAESLTGRNVKLFLTPLLFSEVVQNQSWAAQNLKLSQIEENFPAQLRALLLRSVVYGNYPEAVTTVSPSDYLLNLSSDYLLKDVYSLGTAKTPEVIKKLLLLLAHQVGSEVSVNELANNLGIARVTVEKYLDLLEQTYVIFRLPAFSTNPRKEIVKSKKVYFWDTGVRNALLNEFSENPLRSDIGPLWENWVVAEIAKNNLQFGGMAQLYFWRLRGGSEVDLVVKEGEKIAAFEIKWSGEKAASRAFTKRYKLPVTVINSTRALTSVALLDGKITSIQLSEPSQPEQKTPLD